MSKDPKFQRLLDVLEIQKFERLTGENRARGGFRNTIAVHSDRPSRVELWTPGMQVPTRPTFMTAESPAKAYRQRVRDEQWRAKMARQGGSTNLANMRKQQEAQLVRLQAELRSELSGLSAQGRAARLQDAIFGPSYQRG